MRYIVFLLTTLFVASLPLFSETNTYSGKKDKQIKRDKGATDSTPKTVYDKLFKDKKLHTASRGIMTVHTYEDKLYLEMPLALMRREFLINPVITASSDLKLPLGVPAAKNQYVIIEKTDSLVLFTMPGNYTRLDENAGAHSDAFVLSQANAIGKAFPIEGYTADSTSVLFEVTSYFTGNNPDMLTLKGRNYDGLIYISNCVMQDKVSYIDGIRAFENCISIIEAGTLQLTLAVIGIEYSDKPEVSVSLQMVMALLPKEKMKPREADPHIGSGTVAYTDYRDANRPKKGYFTTRRDIMPQKPVVVHLDTLLKPSWREAIRKSADGWNRVFEKIGLGNPVVLREFSPDSTFHADDPLESTISFLDYDRYDITLWNITDPRTGEILSSKIGIPRDFSFLVRRKGTNQMAEVDERFRTYFIPDDVVCEALTVYMLRAFGLSFGLVANLAGSMAYSPEQLRSPEFTRENGITASVMDDVLYNYLARPGDREKGVELVVSKPGICDEFALYYLYAPINGDEEKELKTRALQHNGNPLYFYGNASGIGSNDPRCQTDDLGNDPFAAIDAKIDHLKYIVLNSPAWLDRDDIPQSYMNLFQSSVYSEFNRSMQTLFRHIGGVYSSVPEGINSHPVYIPVPAEMQRKMVRKIIEVSEKLSWMNNRDFLSLRVANTSLSYFVFRHTKMPIYQFMTRLTKMENGVEKSKGGEVYAQRNFLDDVETYIFEEVKRGEPLSEKKILYAEAYIDGLLSASPTLSALEKTVKNTGSGSGSLTENDLFLFYLIDEMNFNKGISDSATDKVLWNLESTALLRFTGKSGIEPLCYEKLSNARSLLRKALTHTNDQIMSGKIMFLIKKIERVLL